MSEQPNASQFPNRGLLKIYFHISENSGVGYYRQYLPALKLREHGLADTMISDFKWGIGDHVEPNGKFLLEILNWADMVVVGRKDQGEFYAQWGGLKELFNFPIVMDTDDNINHVRPTNPGYQGYFPGSEAQVWNKYGMAKVFDAITVSTTNLKDWYKKYNPKIFELPNNLDVKWWDGVEKTTIDDEFIRMAFIGSAAHGEGMTHIKKPVLDILEKHKNVKFLVSKMFASIFGDHPRVEGIEWIKLEEWPEKYKKLGIDIGLAPLADNLFNRGKSNLRWMEYAIQKIPTIVSPVEAYSCVRDGVDALVAKEPSDWFDAMEKLILDKELRIKMGTTAYERIKSEYNIDLNIGLWYNTYKDIHDKYHEFFGKKKQFVISNKGLQEMRGKRKT